ncbi:glutathione S-transferase family protein [Pseudoxanthomonas putridarboris]|uniref:Glutathione S-transferase family protein n=1 Tax=Pseudoxanthomonas putridarboris TaxID=752605 RepID=A0ABU9J004_9GAMM
MTTASSHDATAMMRAQEAASTRSSARRNACLVGEAFSPWTQKARWALEYGGISHGYREYTPTLSEPRLRWELRQWRGAVSVPVLLLPDRVLRGSWDITCHADACTGDGRLGELARISGWNTRADAGLAEGRARLLAALEQDRDALTESLPTVLPSMLAPALRPVARDAIARLQRKYAHLAQPGAMRRALTEARERVQAHGGGFLLGRFSYADMVAATLLEMVRPRAQGCALGAASQRCWTDAALADEFADLLAWRERLLADPGVSPSWWREPRREPASAAAS